MTSIEDMVDEILEDGECNLKVYAIGSLRSQCDAI